MNETMFNWDDLRLFLAVARGGGLAGAAAATGKSAPTLGRRMLALERRLGQELFRRLPRGYALTEDGEALLARAASLESQVLPLTAAASTRARPLVKVSAGHWVTWLLCGRLTDIVRQDEIRLRFVAADEVLDIGRREAAIGVRNRRPTQAGLAGRRIGEVRFAAYARDPSIENSVRAQGSTPSSRWTRDAPPVPGDVEVTNPRNALDLALTGAARAVLPTFVGARFDELRQVSPPIESLTHDQWLVTHDDDRFLPDVRTVIDRIHSILKDAADAG